MQRSKDGGEGTAPGDEDGELTKAAEEHRRMTCGGDPIASTVSAREQDEHAGSLA